MQGASNHVPLTDRPHFVLVPQMAQGHTIPMIDMAHILANHGAVVTFVTTPRNAARFESIIQHARDSQLTIRFVPLPFNGAEVGLPEGCESVDSLPLGLKQLSAFAEASLQLRDPLISYLRENDPLPSCVISDMTHPWTGVVAREFGVPRLSFIGFSAFSSLARIIELGEAVRAGKKISENPKPSPLEIVRKNGVKPLYLPFSAGRARKMAFSSGRARARSSSAPRTSALALSRPSTRPLSSFLRKAPQLVDECLV